MVTRTTSFAPDDGLPPFHAGPIPSGIYKPGEAVRFRPIRGLEQNPISDGFTTVTAWPPFLVGATRPDPAVEVIDPTWQPACDKCAPPDSGDVTHEEPLPEGVQWVEMWTDRLVSVGDRFSIHIQHDSSPHTYLARDTWTREEVDGLRTLTAAKQWCQARVKGNELNWKTGNGIVYTARANGREYRVCAGVRQSHFVGIDTRFGNEGDAVAHAFRESPDFETLDEAQAWCSIRASCVVESGGTLRFDPDATRIPF